MKKIWLLGLCLALAFSLAACQQTSDKKKESEGITTTTTTTTAENLGGTGGDLDECEIHSPYYHNIEGNWTDDQSEIFWNFLRTQGEYGELFNIVEFVKCNNIPREDFPMWAGWTTNDFWDGDLDKPCLVHWEDCPYTYNQFLDAIYGDDPELSEWVFSMETIRDCW